MLYNINPCPAEPRFVLFFENTIDLNQVAYNEAITSGCTLFSTPIESTCFIQLDCCWLTG